QAQPIERLRQSELFADKSIDKAAAADLASRLQAAIHTEQSPPWRQRGFARQQVAKNNPVALQQLARMGLEPCFAADRAITETGAPKRPASDGHGPLGAFAARNDPQPAPFQPLTLGSQKNPEA